MIKFERIASEAELEDRKRESVASLGPLRVAEPEPRYNAAPLENLSSDLRNYLILIRNNAGMAATKRDGLVGIKPKQGVTLRKKPKQLGLIEEFWATPEGHGRNFKDVRLTPKGLGCLEN